MRLQEWNIKPKLLVLYFKLYKSPERENIVLFSRNRCTYLPIIGGHHFIPKEAILINKRVTFLLNGHLG